MDFYLSRSLSRWNWSTPLHPLLPIAGMIPPLPTCAKIPSLPSVVVGRSSIDLLSTFNMWWELHLHDFLYGLPSRSPMSSLSIAVVVEVFDLTGDMHLTPSVSDRNFLGWDSKQEMKMPTFAGVVVSRHWPDFWRWLCPHISPIPNPLRIYPRRAAQKIEFDRV